MSENLKSALGIEIGDIAWTSYGSGKYQVTEVAKPRRFQKAGGSNIFIFREPVTSLVCRDLDYKTRNDSYLNQIRRIGNRYFSTQNDEIFIEKPSKRQTYQLDLFSLLEPTDNAPYYPFQPQVDYQKGAGFVWQCGSCGLDFNTDTKHKLPCYAPCNCRLNLAIPIFYFDFPAGIPTYSYPSTYICALNIEDYKPSQWSKKINA